MCIAKGKKRRQQSLLIEDLVTWDKDLISIRYLINNYLRGPMKFTNSPFAILDKNMNALDYQKRNLIYEDFWRRERGNQPILSQSR